MAEIDEAKGLLILLVVIGHLIAPHELPASQAWWGLIVKWIYTFHMPAFFFVGGMLSLRSLRVAVDKGPLGFFVSRADRLLVPFLLLGLLMGISKFALEQWGGIEMRGDISRSLETIIPDLVWNSSRSPAGLIWFLWAYFLSLLCALPFVRSREWLWVLFGISAALFLFKLPQIAYLNKFAAHFVFFCGGLLAMDADIVRLRPTFAWTLAGVAVPLSFIAVIYWDHVNAFIPITGMAAGPLLITLFAAKPTRAMEFLGRHSMAIYLLHFLFVAGLAIGLGKVWPQRTTEWFAAMCLLTLPASILCPVMVKKLVELLFPGLARYLA